MRKLHPEVISDVFSLSWIKHAVKSLSDVHADIKTLLMELQFPVSDWDERWIHEYFENSVKMLDICNTLSAELARLDQGQLLLRYVLRILDIPTSFPSSEQLRRARVSLDDWLKKQANSLSPKLEKCHAILQILHDTLCLPRIKYSAKGRVLMRAFYGVEVMTLFTCSIIIAALTGCSKPLMDLHIVDEFLWLEAFNNLQAFLNEELRRQFLSGKVMMLKEIKALKMSALMFHSLTNRIDYGDEPAQLSMDVKKDELNSPMEYADPERRRRLQECMTDLTDGVVVFGHELDSLSKQVNDFFHILLTGRDALLCNLRASSISKKQ
ncbi:hypothetical protein OPV22_002200 [Ensete ventricosum]|uniref:DUF3475 domain-containing protein n=1 Tax=Ensete ventricosum TaxID=4639 RepID=A0AAV8RXB5_ENSVE|nr:hypothetical protein OPV22_002200 [Ensete ventricosum]